MGARLAGSWAVSCKVMLRSLVGAAIAASTYGAGAAEQVVECDRTGQNFVTPQIQQAIDAASVAGGGVVRLEKGDYLVQQLYLKDNVTLCLDAGATLLGSTNKTDYAGFNGLAKGCREWRALVSAAYATNICVKGQGKIDGRGWSLGPHDKSGGRWKDVFFYRCKDVAVEGVWMVNPASWTFYLRECENVTVRHVTIRAPWTWNNDGIDIDAKNVLIEDCDIDADDDAICPKSDNPDFICENVEVRNCRLASCCNHIKLGTASWGGFRNINIHHCQLVSSVTNIIPQVKFADEHRKNVKPLPGVDERDILSRIGIAVECVDGGIIDNVHIHDIEMTRCVQTPILVRLGRRRERPGALSELKHVLIENVKGESASFLASSITGVPGLRPQDVVIRNCEFRLKGGALAKDCAAPVPEAEKAYPENRMFNRHMLPAYGFYLRHADGVTLDNVKLTYTGTVEERPPVVQDDCNNVTIKDCSFQPPSK